MEVIQGIEALRSRPQMFIGNQHMIDLFKQLTADCLASIENREAAITVTLLATNSYRFSVKSPHTLDDFIAVFYWTEWDKGSHWMPFIVASLSDKLEIAPNAAGGVDIDFSLNQQYYNPPAADCFELLEAFLQVAMLNRNARITLVDERGSATNQYHFHFPEGVRYKFERLCRKALGKTAMQIAWEGTLGKNDYQLILAYRGDWFPEPAVACYANDLHNPGGGSLAQGILDGYTRALEAFLNERDSERYEVNAKSITNGLMIVGHVRGGNFRYGGSWHEILEEPDIEAAVADHFYQVVRDYFDDNPEVVESFIKRFDSTSMASLTYGIWKPKRDASDS